VTQAIKLLLALIGVDDAPTYHRRKTTTQGEVTNMVLASAQYLDDETVLKHLPFLNIDEIDDILIKRDKEEAERFKDIMAINDANKVKDGEDGQSKEAVR
jgi:hypothetical protein